MPRLRHLLNRARVPAKLAPAGATTFLDPEESAAAFRVLSDAMTRGAAALLDGDGSALLSAHRKLDAGRTHVPHGPRLVHVPRRGEA